MRNTKKPSDFYDQINERIERHIRELTAIKNYDLMVQRMASIELQHYQLIYENLALIEAIKRLKLDNQDLANTIAAYEQEFQAMTKDWIRQDVKIQRLEKALGFRRPITTGNKAEIVDADSEKTVDDSK